MGRSDHKISAGQSCRTQMRSAEALRRALGPDCLLTVAQIERAQADLAPLARLVVDLYRAQKLPLAEAQASALGPEVYPLTAAECVDIENRTAIYECDGGLTPTNAERRSLSDWRRERK